MRRCEIIDTFPAFLRFWERLRTSPLDTQIEHWATDYMSQWPGLLTMQQRAHAEENCDWREIAKQRVFPFLEERLPSMAETRRALLASAKSLPAAHIPSFSTRTS